MKTKTTTTTHTPVPWIMYESKDNQGFFYIQKGMNGDKAFPAWSIALIPNYQNNDRENGAFIVRACNAHDDLLAALEWAISVLDDPNAILDSRYLALARAAIAKAKGVI